mmetsp:Transcript_16593/g.51649  ORF Transcript_16593/g.51649 Transcript_16593/m.51649 type:complete len:663 (-) Transcript_16593:71-2059(-)
MRWVLLFVSSAAALSGPPRAHATGARRDAARARRAAPSTDAARARRAAPSTRRTEPRTRRGALAFGDAATALFEEYEATVPEAKRASQNTAWSIVEEAYGRAGGFEVDASAFDGALAAFKTPGPPAEALAALPEPAAAIMKALGDTACAYAQTKGPRLGWGTAYRTLARDAGAFFGGFALWPSDEVDVPNFTLYFGSGSPANPRDLFMRLECVPRVDVATDAEYAERYYAPFTKTCLKLMTDDARFRPYVSTSPYARGCLAPSGVRVFFDAGDASAVETARAAALELAGLWADSLATAAPVDAATRTRLAARDAVVRRVAADASPDNINRKIVYGPDLFKKTKDLLAGAANARKSPRVLCVGCSGGTGIRAVRGLLEGGVDPATTKFITRDPSKPAAKTLAALGLEPIVADLDDAASLVDIGAGCDAVYVHGTTGDEKQIDKAEAPRAKALAEALATAKTPPLVIYNSVAAPDDTGIPRIEQKHAAEAAFRSALPGRTAILRAHLFMEELWKGYTRPSIAKGTYGFSVPRDKPLCLTSVKDMGAVAARCAFEDAAPAAPLEVVSDVLSPLEMAAAFGDAQGSSVKHRQSWALYLFSRVLLPELHQIIRFYRKTDFEPYAAAAAPAMAAALREPAPLQSFAGFLEETGWGDASRTYEDLARES